LSLSSSGLFQVIEIGMYEKCYPMFSDITKNLDPKMVKSETFENGCV
jgi:hypothetical protein